MDSGLLDQLPLAFAMLVSRNKRSWPQAPVLLTFCSDVFRMRKWIRVNDSRQSFDDPLGFLAGALDASSPRS